MSDLVLYNARIHTLEPGQPRASAIALNGERILALGDDASMRATLGSGGAAVDLRGRPVIPGLVDAHIHFEEYSLGLRTVNVEVPTLDAALRRVAERAAATRRGDWITGQGWNQTVWGSGAFPSAADLDRVAPEHPVLLSAKSGHAVWANTAALRLAGVTAGTPDPAGGSIQRHASGEPTGILFEKAIDLVDDACPKPSAEESAAAIREAIPAAWRAGLTGIHDFDEARALSAYQLLRERGQLGLRVVKSIPFKLTDHAIALGVRTGLGDDWLRVGGVKAFADGALGTRTAAMFAPFEGEPGNLGILRIDQEELHDLASRASAAGLSMAIHAIGDRAIHEVLDVLEAVRGEEAARGVARGQRRHRIEHVQLLHPDDFGRLAQLGIIASMQPLHATSDMLMVDRYWGARGRGAYAFRTQLAAGAALAFGSDCPVEVFPPLIGIHAAVTRRRADGTPGPDGWYPDQRLSVAEAVRGFTWGPAYAAGWEDRLGTLAPGKLADLVVLADDIFEVDPMSIAQVPVNATMVAGRFVYRSED